MHFVLEYGRRHKIKAEILGGVASGAARALVTGVKLAMEGPPGRVGPLKK